MRRSVRLTAVLVAAAAVSAAANARQSPTVDQIIARNLEAKGGIATLKATTSVRMIGTVAIYRPGSPTPQTMAMTVSAKRPNLVMRDMTVGDRTVSFGFDGTTVWQSTPMGVQPVTGPQADNIRSEAEFDPVFLTYKQQGHTVELLPDETLDGRKVHHLKVTRKNGPEQHYYLDAATALEAKVATEVDADGQKLRSEMLLSDYRTVDGRTVPFKARQMLNGDLAAELTFEKVEFNVPMEDSIFRMPAAGK